MGEKGKEESFRLQRSKRETSDYTGVDARSLIKTAHRRLSIENKKKCLRLRDGYGKSRAREHRRPYFVDRRKNS